jgi:hypothetical protein
MCGSSSGKEVFFSYTTFLCGSAYASLNHDGRDVQSSRKPKIKHLHERRTGLQVTFRTLTLTPGLSFLTPPTK